MKKFFSFCCLTLALCAAGLNARGVRPTFAPNSFHNQTSMVWLDSVALYDHEEGGDELYSIKYYSFDSVLNAQIVNLFQNNGAGFLEAVSRVYYNPDGTIRLTTTSIVDSVGNESLYDSIVYTYGTNSKTVIEYWDEQGVLVRHDSTYYEYNAQKQVTLVDSFSFEESVWELTEKQMYYYDENTNLLTKAEYFIKNGAEEIMHSKEEYSYDNNGRDTLRLHYSWDISKGIYPHYKITLFYDAATGLKTHGYRLYSNDQGATWDSSYIYLYTYDEENRLIRDETKMMDNRVDEKVEYTYDQWGNVFSIDNFGNTQDEMQYMPLYIEYFYYSDHTPEPSAVENVTEEKERSTKIEKVMIDGRIYIIRNGVTFDIMGRRVK